MAAQTFQVPLLLRVAAIRDGRSEGPQSGPLHPQHLRQGRQSRVGSKPPCGVAAAGDFFNSNFGATTLSRLDGWP